MSNSKKSNSSLNNAAKVKNDEHYTKISDIEAELDYYKHHLRDKKIFCNCDNPEESSFFKFFAINFTKLGLKSITTTFYCAENKSYQLTIDKDVVENGKINLNNVTKIDLNGSGDFRSKECEHILKDADIVITNPPFSLFREYIAQLSRLNKKFLLIGNQNAITYKEIFPLIKNNLVWIGNTYPKEFIQSDGSVKKFGNICWYTNLFVEKRLRDIPICKPYIKEDYPRYDNYNAIEVSRVDNIPIDYTEVMGVPITFMNKYNPNQFEILGATESEGKGFSNGIWDKTSNVAQPLIDNKRKYKRIFIKNKSPLVKKESV